MRYIYARCDLVLGQSRSFCKHIGARCAASTQVRYFPNWAELLFDVDIKQTVPAAELFVDSGTFTVMFAGNLGEAQDFPAVLHAVELLRQRSDVRWVILGDGRMNDWIRNEVARRGLGDRVALLGRYPLQRMPSFYRHAGALLVSLKAEPIFGLTIPAKIQSYLAAGIPILAMLNGEGAAVIRDSGAGFACDAGDGAGLAALVQQMASLTAAQRQAMGEAGRAYCREHFDRNDLVQELETMLAQQVSKTPAPRPSSTRVT